MSKSPGPLRALWLLLAVVLGVLPMASAFADGSIRCWGWNGYGQCDVPSGVGEPGNLVTAVAAGGSMTVALLAPTACSGDLTGDDLVDGADLTDLLGFWGDCVDPLECPPDLDGNGQVDGADLLELLSAWGACP